MPSIVNEQTSYMLKTGGFAVAEQPDHLLVTHRDSGIVIRVEPGDMPTDIVNKLIIGARKFP